MPARKPVREVPADRPTLLPPVLVPERGLIRGGEFDKWQYTLVRVVDRRNEFQVYLEMRVTQSEWPFPRDVSLRAWRDFDELLPDPAVPRRERADLHDWNDLLAEAVQAALDAEVMPKEQKISAGATRTLLDHQPE